MIKELYRKVLNKVAGGKYAVSAKYGEEASLPKNNIAEMLYGYFIDEDKLKAKLEEKLFLGFTAKHLKSNKSEMNDIEIVVDATSCISYGIFEDKKKKVTTLLELLYTDTFNRAQKIYANAWYVKPDISISDKKVVLKYNFSRRHSSLTTNV